MTRPPAAGLPFPAASLPDPLTRRVLSFPLRWGLQTTLTSRACSPRHSHSQQAFSHRFLEGKSTSEPRSLWDPVAGLRCKPCLSDSQGLLLNGFIPWCPRSLRSQVGRCTGIWLTQALPSASLIQVCKGGWSSPQRLNRKPQAGPPELVLGQQEPKRLLSL